MLFLKDTQSFPAIPFLEMIIISNEGFLICLFQPLLPISLKNAKQIWPYNTFLSTNYSPVRR